MGRWTILGAGLGALVTLAAFPAAALVVGQTDDFQDATTQGWGVGPARRALR